MHSPFPTYKVHPATFKAFTLGHPWMTKDSYNQKFPKNSSFIIALDSTGTKTALILHDPFHKEIKGRLWSLKGPFSYKKFQKEFKERLYESIKKRVSSNILNERDDLYLSFGEADFLPGLFIIMLKDRILIQVYSSFWISEKKLLLETLHAHLKTFFKEKKFIISIQIRDHDQKFDHSEEKQIHDQFVLTEFGINYLINLGISYDFGLYPDMASIRKVIAPYIQENSSLLNLFSYTGAFSLLGLSKNCHKVVSVDLSRKYLDWCKENILLNPKLDSTKHIDLCMTADLALKSFIKNQEFFNYIICDPPSSFSDKKKRFSAMQMYEKTLPLLLKTLEKQGLLFIFLNTHKISIKKWQEKIDFILKKLDNSYKIERLLNLSEDCPILTSFAQGNYLKGLVIKRIF